MTLCNIILKQRINYHSRAIYKINNKQYQMYESRQKYLQRLKNPSTLGQEIAACILLEISYAREKRLAKKSSTLENKKYKLVCKLNNWFDH